ncbi:MAG TPA: MFS transporter [Patescibacteria group bacterium]|nr:MFS transporter [Patescibacteria group bacterium]
MNRHRVHYSWVILLTTFVALLIAAGVRSTPGVLIVPFEQYFGWNRAQISAALAVNLLLYGFCGPFAAALLELYGVRRVMTAALLLIILGTGMTTGMTASWQLMLLWGLVVGMGSGFLSPVLGTVVANRWFVKRRGLAVGIFSAAGSAGQIIFLPVFSWLLIGYSWQAVTWFISFTAVAAAGIVIGFMRNRPEDLDLLPYGAEQKTERLGDDDPWDLIFAGLKAAITHREFWLISGSFFVCGASTGGLVGTHFIPACVDHGVPEVTAAGILAASGVCNLIGAVAAGWLSDKFDNRWLLFWFYLLRGITLAWLPFELGSTGSISFILIIVFYGLDWVATIPPTVRLVSDIFGPLSGVVFGWMMVIHQIGAALAAYSGGVLHSLLGSYQWPFISCGILCFLAAGLVVKMKNHRQSKVAAVSP